MSAPWREPAKRKCCNNGAAWATTHARATCTDAPEVVARFAGRFPSQPDALAGLPGIGRSSAAAIAVFSYGVRAAILDGNVRRVLCRHFGMEGDPSRAATQRELWAIAERELPHESIVAYTQGLMDLGATVCTRSSPDCSRCPLASTCVALRDDAVDRLPTTRARAPLPIRAQSLLLVRSGSRLLLERRPSSGLWGGLWCPPVVDGPALEHLAPTSVSVVSLPPGILNALAAIGVELSSVATAAPLETFQHVFTHFRLHAQPWLIDLCDHGLVATDSSQRWRWHRLDDLSGAALPKPIKVLLAGIGPGRGAKQT